MTPSHTWPSGCGRSRRRSARHPRWRVPCCVSPRPMSRRSWSRFGNPRRARRWLVSRGVAANENKRASSAVTGCGCCPTGLQAGGNTRARASGADLVHPLTVGPAPHILADSDDRTAQRADLAWSVRFVVVPQGAVLIVVTYSLVLLPRHAQILLHSLFNFPASEIWWGCHMRPPTDAMV